MSHRKPVAGRRGTLVAALLASSVLASAAAAQERTYAFDLQAEPLADALRDYGKAADRQLIFAPDLVRGRQAHAVLGRYSADQALDLLLSGTDLTWRRAPAGGIMIVRRTASSPPDTAAATDASAEPPREVQEVLVTGTRIAGIAPVGARPVVLGRQDIEASGRSTAADVLRLLPQATSLGVGEEARRGTQGGASNSSAANVVNLRGLGGDATLTLFNGHRLASANLGGLVDIGQIPLLALDRIEVLTDGASALYGSDAVAGVVNFVLRRDYDGQESLARYGQGDGFGQLTLGHALGRTWSSGSVFVAAQYFDQSSLAAAERSFYSDDLRPFGGPNLRSNNGIPGTIIAGGITYAIPPGQNGVGLTPNRLVAGTANRRNRWTDADILPSTEIWNAALNLRQTLTPQLDVFLDALVSERRSRRNDLASEATLTVPRSNPFFVNPNPVATTTTVAYNFASDLGPLQNKAFAQDLSGHGGFELRLPWDWEVSASGLSSRNRTEERLLNQVSLTRVNQALADPNPATAFNPFGDRGSNGATVLDRIRASGANIRRSSLNSLNLDASGPLITLPAGALKLAVGAERRWERLHAYSPSTTGATPTLLGVTNLRRRIDSIYGEAFVPLVSPDQGLAFLQSLTVSAALRGEDYSDLGETWNPRLGVELTPLPGLLLSGTWGTSFKAPTLTQAVPSTAFLVQALGLQSGVANVIVIGGTQTLKPETAETWTVSVEWAPGWAPGLTVNATYFDIDYRDRILRPTGNEFIAAIAAGCNSPIIVRCNPTATEVQALYSDPRFRGANRPPSSTIAAIVDNRFQNLGVLTEAGLDLRVVYAVETDFGDLRFDAALTYLTSYRVARIAGQRTVSALDTSSNPIDLRARAGVTWRRDGWTAAFAVNYVDDYTNTVITPNQPVSDWATADARVAYTFGTDGGMLQGASVALDVRNLFDRDPPKVAQVTAAYGYDPEHANALGRVVGLTLAKRW